MDYLTWFANEKRICDSRATTRKFARKEAALLTAPDSGRARAAHAHCSVSLRGMEGDSKMRTSFLIMEECTLDWMKRRVILCLCSKMYQQFMIDPQRVRINE